MRGRLAFGVVDYSLYEQRMQEAVNFSRSGDNRRASRIFEELADDPELSDMDRAINYQNSANCATSSRPAKETESLFDQAISLERKWYRSTAREAKAQWLVQTGRSSDAASIYNELIAEPWLTIGQRRGFEESLFRIRP